MCDYFGMVILMMKSITARIELFLKTHKIWFEIFTPMSVLVALIFGVWGIYLTREDINQTKESLYLQFRPYINLASISFDGKSDVSLEFVNKGQSIARDVYFVFAKFKDDRDFGMEAFDYIATTGNFLASNVADSTVEEGEEKRTAKMLIPVSFGEVFPDTSRHVGLHLKNEGDILWLKEKGNWVSLKIQYTDLWGVKQEHYYAMEYDSQRKSFIFLSESSETIFPINYGNLGKYYLGNSLQRSQ